MGSASGGKRRGSVRLDYVHNCIQDILTVEKTIAPFLLDAAALLRRDSLCNYSVGK